MPPPIKVRLMPYDPYWAEAAIAEATILQEALGRLVLRVHHVGSTAIPGIAAKPILDLVPVVQSMIELDAQRHTLEALGYVWWGEFGLPGRRYCTRDDAGTGERLVQIHCYAEGSGAVDQRLAFRDYLREKPDVARAYEEEKLRCQWLHPDDSRAYSACKAAWIERTEAEALAYFHCRGMR